MFTSEKEAKQMKGQQNINNDGSGYLITVLLHSFLLLLMKGSLLSERPQERFQRRYISVSGWWTFLCCTSCRCKYQCPLILLIWKGECRLEGSYCTKIKVSRPNCTISIVGTQITFGKISRSNLHSLNYSGTILHNWWTFVIFNCFSYQMHDLKVEGPTWFFFF